MRIYISHRELDAALAVGKMLVEKRHDPFVPRLSKLITGISDEEWVRYYASWIYQCDVVWAMPDAREHELAIAKNAGILVVYSFSELQEVHLPKYKEFLKEFSSYIALHLEHSCPDEEWRRTPVVEILKKFEDQCGKLDMKLASDRRVRYFDIAALAFCAWDAEQRNPYHAFSI